MALAYDDDMPPSIPSEDNDENEVHEEALNEMFTGFLGTEIMMILQLTIIMIQREISNNIMLMI